MKNYSTILSAGLLISFTGSLAPGAINIAALQIALQQGKQAAFTYAIGSMLAELVIVRLALYGIKRILNYQRLFFILEIFTAVLLVLLTTACFVAAGGGNGINNIFNNHYLPPFKTGLLLSLLNPLHLPFWLGWVTVLMDKNILSPQPAACNWFITGIGIGTIAGSVVFINTGEILLSFLENYHLVFYLLVGFALSLITLFHIRKMTRSSLSARYAGIRGKIRLL